MNDEIEEIKLIFSKFENKYVPYERHHNPILITNFLISGDNLTYLKPWEGTNTTLAMINNAANMSTENTVIGEQFELFFLPVPTAAFMFMAISSIVLAFIAFALLLHLAIFHLYINHVGITTYEYVRAHRLALEPQTMQLSDPANNQLATVKENQEDQTTDSNCCQIFTRKAKVAPAPAEPTSTTATEHSNIIFTFIMHRTLFLNTLIFRVPTLFSKIAPSS